MSYLLDALRKLEKEKEQHKPMTLGESPSEIAVRDRRRNVGLWALVGINILLIAGVLIWLFMPTPEAPEASRSLRPEAVVAQPEPAQTPQAKMPEVMAKSAEPVPAQAVSTAPPASIPPVTTTAVAPELTMVSPAATSAGLAEPPDMPAPALQAPKTPFIAEPISVPEPVSSPPPEPIKVKPTPKPVVPTIPPASNLVAKKDVSSSRPDYTAARVFTGTLDGVKGGCLVELREGSVLHQAVLEGVRCPKKGEAFWKEARSFTTRAAFGRSVRVAVWGANVDGALLCDLHTEDGLFVNAEIAKAGLAWATGNALKRFENEARKARRGMWDLGGE